MQKLIGKWWAKTIAAILCVASLITAVVSLCAIVYQAETAEDSKMDGIYEQIATNYAAAALSIYQNADSYDAFLQEVTKKIDPQMKYAIVQSTVRDCEDNIQSLAQKIGAYESGATYLYGTPEIVKNADYVFCGGEYYIYRYNTVSLLGMLSNGYGWERIELEDSMEEVVRVWYVRENRRFYYETDSGFYPVHTFCIDMGEETQQYTLTLVGNEYKYLDAEGKEPKADVFEDGFMVQMENANCAMRQLTYNEELVLENPGEYVLIADSLLYLQPQESVFEYEDTYISNGYLKHKQTIEPVYYYVFSYVDESVSSVGFPGFFTEAREWATYWEQFSYYAIGIEVLSVIVFLCTLVFLLYAAGHRSGDSKIHLGFLDTIWFEVISVVVFLLDMMYCMLMVYAVEWGGFKVSGMLTVELELAFALGITSLLYLLTFTVRIKAKKFWRYTCVYWCYKLCEKIWKKLWSIPVRLWNRLVNKERAYVSFYRERTSLLGKTIVTLAVVSLGLIISFAILCVGGFYSELYIFWMMLVLIFLWLLSLSLVMQMTKLQEGSKRIAEGNFTEPIDTKGLFWEFRTHAENINKVGDGIARAVEKQMKSERFRTELITNVSHDIKTPLTSIINYVDLIKKEDIENEQVQEYIEVLDRQSSRLKKLIEDLMEASKASTGNLAVHFERCDARVLLTQIVGEFEEKTSASQLDMIVENPDYPVNVMVDSRHIWRVLDNLLGNICKYAQPQTRVYINLVQEGNEAVIYFKNISKYRLNISGEELMERFVRGDSSRNTEGSGLGLSIAQSLTNLMHGTLELMVDGDLFKVILRFPIDNS